MKTEIESLGNLATHAELQAARSPADSYERESWLNAARRYRTAQETELLRDTFNPEPYPLATVLTEGPSPAFKRICYSLLFAAVVVAFVLVITL